MYIYYCANCNGFNAFEEESGSFMCSVCQKPYLPLKVTVDAWNNMSNDEMLSTIERAKKPHIKIPVFTKAPEEESNDIVVDDTFHMATITVSCRGSHSRQMDWCITGYVNNPKAISVGDIVDVYNTRKEIISTLTVGEIDYWHEKIPKKNPLFLDNEITLIFKGETENYKLGNAFYVGKQGLGIPSDSELEDLRNKDKAAFDKKNGPEPTSYLEKSLKKMDVEKKANLVSSPEEAEKYRQILMGEREPVIPGNPSGVKCPYCGSKLCSKIGHLNKGASIAVWGLASNKLGKQWKCNSCGSTF